MTNELNDWPQSIRTNLDGVSVVVSLSRETITAGLRLVVQGEPKCVVEGLAPEVLRDLAGTLHAARHELEKVARARADRKSATELFVTTMGGAEAAEAALADFVGGSAS